MANKAKASVRECLFTWQRCMNSFGIPLFLRRSPRDPKGAMMSDKREDTTIYKVVVNHEEQYSIWPADRENALGWNDAGKQGTKAECLAYIEEVWTDMRPLSLRKKMEEAARKP
jgi:MbtH protein